MRMYMCVHVCVYSACVYVCTCIYVCLWMYAYTFICARVWVHICTRVGAFCLFFVYLYCPISLLHARVSQVFLNTFMRVCGGIGSGVCFSLFMVSACYWRGRLCFGRGRDRGFVLYISLFLRVLGWWVCVWVCVFVNRVTLMIVLL